ncbi:hypothetical protein LSAT2_000181 [Lamellibrachia satsuma]|nr:hypothetical protein LSAT2_000181 [Lamellibrachia satsuma]
MVVLDAHMVVLDAHMVVVLDTHMVVLEGHMVVLDAHMVVLDAHMVVLDAHMVVLDAHLVVLDARMVVLKGHMVVLDAHMVVMDAIMLVLDAHMVVLDTHMVALDTHMVVLDAHMVVLPLPCKWKRENIRWKKKLQELHELCLQNPKKLVKDISGQISMCKSKQYEIAKGLNHSNFKTSLSTLGLTYLVPSRVGGIRWAAHTLRAWRNLIHGYLAELQKQELTLSEASDCLYATEERLLEAQLYRKSNWQQLTWAQINGLFSTTCPSILLLVDLLLNIPVATTECERGFSRMNRIKNEFRTRLQPGIMIGILRIQLASQILNYGTVVYLGFITNDGREAAIKKVEKHNDQRLNKRVEKEVEALIGLKHPNIVEYMMLIKQNTVSYIALELCDYTLDKWISRKKVIDLTEDDWRMKSVHLIGDLLCGLEHMHTKKMLHRDLKPQNLFVVQLANGSQCLKIGDFDLCRGFENGASTVHTAAAGTKHWLPKEVIVQKNAPSNDATSDNESTDSESSAIQSTANESTTIGSTTNESTTIQSTDNESTTTESTANESTTSGPAVFDLTADKSIADESTDSESTDSESTDSESTDSESTDSESTDSESTDSESTDSEPTDSVTNIKYKRSGDIQTYHGSFMKVGFSQTWSVLVNLS